MSLDEILKKVKVQMEEEVEAEYVPWPPTGTKDWFQKYVRYMADYASRPGQMPPEQVELIHANLKKFDPKFAELCKKAHDSAMEFMAYSLSKTENK